MPSFIRIILERRILYFVGLFGLGVGLPLGKSIISIGGIVLLGAWLFDAIYFKDLKNKWQLFISNPIAWSMTAIFLLHLIGMIYTSDLNYGVQDLRTKLPLLFMPFIFASLPVIGRTAQSWLLLLHYIAVLICMGIAVAFFSNDADGLRLRDHIHFISHIRLSLLIVMGLLLSILYFRPHRLVQWSVVGVVWVAGLWFLVTAQLMTGLLILLLSIGYFLMRYALKVRRPAISILALILLAGGSFFYVFSAYHTYFDTPTPTFSNQDDSTASGTPYFVPDLPGQVENGHYIWQHYAPAEMEMAWYSRSDADLLADDLRLHGGLTRYLSAKGLRKDKEGVESLTALDITHIEAGMVHPPEMNKGPLGDRFDMLFYEWSSIQNTDDPNGHSLGQRLEYWKTGMDIWSHSPIIGVGTGDVKEAFEVAYIKNESPLRPEFRHRAHQQFLTIMIAFGVIGLIVFLYFFYRPLALRSMRQDLCIVALFLVLTLSFLNEDTLESQAGLTFYVFYMAILALAVGRGRKETSQ